MPGTFAGEDELIGIGRALGEVGHGVFEMASDLAPEGNEFQWMEKPAQLTGRPVTFACLQSSISTPTSGGACCARRGGQRARRAHRAAGRARRPTGLLLGLESTFHPFIYHPSYQASCAALPLAERVARMRDPAFRARILAESPATDLPIVAYIAAQLSQALPARRPARLRARPASRASRRSRSARAGSRRRSPTTCCSRATASELLYFPLLGYADGNFDALRTMLLHPQAVLGLSDGGAHCGIICDASMPTFLLTHWVRDRRRGERIPLEQVVRLQTRNTAELYGLVDRGVLAPGMHADVNVIDFESLRLRAPEIVFDLPANGRRLIQRVDGYRMTLQSGAPIYENGEPTGALPGRLLRGPQPAA